MDFLMGSDIFADGQICDCVGEAPPVFTMPPPPPPPGFQYLQESPEDIFDRLSTGLPSTCPVLINTPEHYENGLFSAVAATCVAALMLVLVIVVTVASRKRPPATYSAPSSTYRAAPSPVRKPSQMTPSHASYASLEPSFAVEYFSTPIKNSTCSSSSYCSPCSSNASSRVFHSTPYSQLESPPSFLPRVVLRHHTPGKNCSHSLALPHTPAARTQPAHPRRSPLYRPRLAKVMSGQLLVLPGAHGSPSLRQQPMELSPLSPRAVDNLYSPLPSASSQTAFVFP